MANMLCRKILLAMRLTVVILIASLLQVSAASLAQKITISQSNVPLKSILKELRTQSGFVFLYSDDVLKAAKPVTVRAENVDFQVVLKLIFDDQPLTYELVDRTVVIKPKALALINTKAKKMASVSLVTGIVTDSLRKPLSGASVKLTPGKFATSTEKNGQFFFRDVPSGSYTLSISSVGFKMLQMDIEVNESTSTSILALVLKETPATLNEVSVNTGYQRIRPEQSTGATASIGTKEYESRINTDFLSGLTNRIPGLMINPDVQFEGNSLFQVRGLSTISGSKIPLIVVDGYPTELTLNMIDPNEIKSVTVLKDAAAATIYGVRASNGVIVIERKQADPGKPRVDFRTTFGVTAKENYRRYRWDPDGNNIVLASDRYIGAQNSPNAWIFMNSPLFGYLLNYSPGTVILAKQGAGLLTADQANQQLTDLASYNNTEDFAKLFLRNASTQTFNLNVSGGNQNAIYYITTNYTANTLQQNNNDNSRLLLSARSILNLSSKLSLELTTDFLKANANAAPIPDINNIYPYERFQDASGNPTSINAGSFFTPEYGKILINQGLSDNQYYPLVDMNEVSNKTRILNNRITANFKYQLNHGFNVTFGGVYENSRTDKRKLATSQSSVVRQLINRYAQPGTGGNILFNIPQGDYLQQETEQTTSYTGRAQLNYNKRFGKDHSINAILGTEIRNVISEVNRTPHFGYNNQSLLQAGVNYATIFGGSFTSDYAGLNPALSLKGILGELYNEDRYLSGYTNVVYSFRDKYTLTGSVRIDQSNLFGTDPKYTYKPLWSVGAGWNIDQEPFMQNMHWLKMLKLRAAYGFNGNIAKDALPQIIASSDYNNYYPVGSNPVPMLSIYRYANSVLRWEQTRNVNIGLDYTIFKGITGNVDFYEKRSTDLLANTQIDATKGGQSAMLNTASIRNRGVEVALHADWLTRNKFNWNTGFIFSHNVGKVLKVYNNTLTPTSLSTAYVSGTNSNYFEGFPVGTLFEYHFAGVDNVGAPLIYNAKGDVKAMLSPNGGRDDVFYAGTSIPPTNIGLSNRIDIGRFYLYTMVNYYGGFKVRKPLASPANIRPLKGAGNFWQKAGDENIPDVLPGRAYISAYSPYLVTSDRYTINGDYFTLGDLTLSYNFGNSAFLKRAGFRQFEIKAQASNVYTVALNKDNYSLATGSYAKRYLTPTYTIGLFTNL